MPLSRQARIQLAIFAVIALVALAVMGLQFMKLPAKLFGVGHYTVTMQLLGAGGLYESSNVTYRGSEVGRVTSLRLTDSGVVAELSLKSGVDIPRDLKAEVHSVSAIGEQYVALIPRNDTSPPLKQGDVIAVQDTSVPTDINTLLDAVRTGLLAVPRDNLKTVLDESYTAVAGLGPQLSTIVKGMAELSSDARANLDAITALIDDAKPVLDTQIRTSGSIQAWASQVATVTRQLRDSDQAVAGVLQGAGPALDESRQLLDRVLPPLPVLLTNLVSVSEVGLTYRNGLEQLLVLFPQLVAIEQGSLLANVNTNQDYRGAYLSFNLNLNLPPPCTTGYLPAQQTRNASFEDYPDLPAGSLYCRVPQDSPFNVRGARNIPCETRPGKRAPTAAMCESDEEYVPLNDGYNWKGDPNATMSGQDIPQLPPGSVTPEPPGSTPTGDQKTWQSMLLPPPAG